ncbi:MAG TPA: FHA domain-containing protein [Polyangia bacterium]|jgi:hypothetical protein|nr:FHA domain-containing protein [Polyangia bacterium]
MSADENHRSPRQFQCSDLLWKTFQRMSEEQEKGLDELINDAMTAYAQLSGYQTGIGDEDTPPPKVSSGLSSLRMTAPLDLGSDGDSVFGGVSTPPPPGSRFGRPISASPSGYAGVQPVPPSPPRVPSDALAGGLPLYLVFDNQKYRIDKDQFIIGRGSKSSDLPIKDGNISRKHAAVIRRNGTYFIKDLGSTNGIDFKGMRIDNKRIDEGDVFHLCDYELRFTYKR